MAKRVRRNPTDDEMEAAKIDDAVIGVTLDWNFFRESLNQLIDAALSPNQNGG